MIMMRKISTFSFPCLLKSCNCNGEVWVSATCQQGFECQGAYDVGNPGNLITCTEGELFYLDLATMGRIEYCN